MTHFIIMYSRISHWAGRSLAFVITLAILGLVEGRAESKSASDFSSMIRRQELRESSLHIIPPVVSRPVFSNGSVRIEFRNKESHPVEALFRLVVDESLFAKPSEIPVNLQAGESTKVEFGLGSSTTRHPSEIPISILEYSLTYKLPNGVAKLKGSRKVGVGHVWAVPKAGRAIVINGDLKDWGWLPIEFEKPAEFQPAERREQWRNRLDGSAKFEILHDSKMLYLAFEVWDDTVRVPKSDDARKNDGILIWGDVTPGGRGTGKPWFIINPGLVETNTDIAPIGGLPKGASAAAKLTGIGYNVEIALPIDYFETLGRDGTGGNSEVYIRLNFAVNDLDRKDEGPVSLFWHPAWLGEKDHGWSGLVTLDSRTAEEAESERRAWAEPKKSAKNKRRN